MGISPWLLLMKKELLKFENVSYSLDKERIVSNINWTVLEGEHWVILGPNGAGKTSLLKLVYGRIWPNVSGTIYRKNQTNIDLGVLRKNIGWVSPDLVQYIPSQETVLETVVSGKYAMFGFWSRTGLISKDKGKASNILEKLGISSFSDRITRTLSTGETQKVLLARVLMSDPYLVLLDEPLAGLDPGAGELFLQTLERYIRAHNEPSFIYVTHHINEITENFSKMIIVNNGNIEYKGDTRSGLSSERISRLYGFPFELKSENNRFHLKIVYPRL